jgi:4-alpha-glucanotransferase
MLAQFLEGPVFEPGPYSPASRLFWNELFVDVPRLPELEGSPEARAALQDPDLRREVEDLHGTELVDHGRAMAAKRRVLAPLAEQAFASPPSGFREFLDATPHVLDYARFRAEVERSGTWWGAWPSRERNGDLQGKAEDDPIGRLHAYAQWAAHRQLAELAGDSEVGLFLDLPLGVNAAGFDAWRERERFLEGISTGAPPDPFFTGGQDWGFRPLHPERIREDGYRYPIACVRTLLRFASFLRIDHVMGLHRLFCVPAGGSPDVGAYLRYRPQEWYALLALEAHRSGALLVGEDLGTVPAYVRSQMRSHGVLRTYVADYEARPDPAAALPEPPPDSLASIDTHDMPPFARFWDGGEVATRVELGLLDEDDAREEREHRRRLRGSIVSFLVSRGLLSAEEPDDPRAVLDACLAALAASDAAIVVAALEDLWLEDRPQNIPGTTTEHPNWRGRMRHPVEELAGLEDLDRTLRRVATLRGAGR